jgi:hypothetical protein
MAFSTTIQPVEKVIKVPANQPSNNISDAVLSMMLLTMYGAQMSKKTVRRLKRKFFFTSLKLKVKSLFKPQQVSDRTLIYIILGAALVALLIIEPVLVLALAAVVLILYLAGVL